MMVNGRYVKIVVCCQMQKEILLNGEQELTWKWYRWTRGRSALLSATKARATMALARMYGFFPVHSDVASKIEKANELPVPTRFRSQKSLIWFTYRLIIIFCAGLTGYTCNKFSNASTQNCKENRVLRASKNRHSAYRLQLVTMLVVKRWHKSWQNLICMADNGHFLVDSFCKILYSDGSVVLPNGVKNAAGQECEIQMIREFDRYQSAMSLNLICLPSLLFTRGIIRCSSCSVCADVEMIIRNTNETKPSQSHRVGAHRTRRHVLTS